MSTPSGRRPVFGFVCLLITALIWGGAFLAQKLGMDHVGPYAFTVYRNVLAGFFLLGVIACLRRGDLRGVFNRETRWAGFWCGLSLFVAMMLQQVGILYTKPGVCAFLTTNYVLAVPILGLALRKVPRAWVWPGAVLAATGSYFLCVAPGEATGIGKGELLTLLCAIGFGVQIMVVDAWVAKPRVDTLGLCMGQFFTGALLGLPFLLLPSEQTLLSWAHLKAGAWAVLFCGILSSGIAYTLQNVGQKHVAPALAAILMSLESAFALLFSWLFLHETLSPRQLTGCALVFVAVILTQLLGHER